jgi:ubiquinone/menaquinone biosynthesis C-methylase UbiE
MDAAANRSESYREWQELAPRWEQGRELLWTSTRPVSEWLVAKLAPCPGETILDVAAGTGETGFLAAPLLGKSGRLITSDLSPNMLDAAMRAAAQLGVENVEFRLLDAERLELADASIDGAFCRFGYVLKGDPPRALRELRRVLRPGGRLAFAVWAERERNAWMTVPVAVMVERGHLQPPSGGELRLSERRNPPTITRLVHDAGFAEAQIEELAVSYRFASSEELWFFVSELRGPVALALDRLDEGEREAVRTAIEQRARPGEGGGYELGGISVNVLAS